MTKISKQQYARALHEALSESPDNAENIIKNFVQTLVNHNQLGHAQEIVDAYESIAREAAGEQNIEITAARALSDDVKSNIAQAFGTQVHITEKHDPSLIGGVRIKTKDTVIDASIKQQLHRLHNTLIA